MLHSTKYHPIFGIEIKKMSSKSNLTRFIFVTLILVLTNNWANSQSNKDSITNAGLYREIAEMDNIMFTAFNTRDTNQFKSLFTQDLEFFHDKGGLTNYDHTISFLKTTAKQNNQLKRELVKGSLEVYPIPGYGAMEIGAHTFCHIENGKQECGTFKFVHIWQKNKKGWQITRVMSYGH